MIIGQFDLSYVINLEQRTDRRREIEQQLNKLGLSDYRIFPAYRPSDAGMFLSRGAHGCFNSHAAILEIAANLNQSVLIIEDDCDFTPEARTYQFPPDTDVFYGGYELTGNDGVIGSHLMGFSAKAAKLATQYLRDFVSPDFTPDPKTASEPGYNKNIRPGSDGAYVWFRRAHPELTVHFADPPIGVQRSSRSDISSRFFDRVPGIRTAASLARSIKRRVM